MSDCRKQFLPIPQLVLAFYSKANSSCIGWSKGKHHGWWSGELRQVVVSFQFSTDSRKDSDLSLCWPWCTKGCSDSEASLPRDAQWHRNEEDGNVFLQVPECIRLSPRLGCPEQINMRHKIVLQPSFLRIRTQPKLQKE